MQPSEQSAVIGMLGRAFYDDPLFGFFLPDLVQQTRGILSFMGSGVVDAQKYGEVWVAHRDGKVASAAAWLRPGGYPRGFRREAMTILRGTPAFLRAGSRIAASLRLLAEVDKRHHELDQPHWYLGILGSDPLFQRTGAGSAVIQPVLDRCDEEGLDAYLETQKEENLAYYARHAFDDVRVLEVKGVPPIWTLLRKPR
jgi:GNAT superfamily N-acetyltransferase